MPANLRPEKRHVLFWMRRMELPSRPMSSTQSEYSFEITGFTAQISA